MDIVAIFEFQHVNSDNECTLFIVASSQPITLLVVTSYQTETALTSFTDKLSFGLFCFYLGVMTSWLMPASSTFRFESAANLPVILYPLGKTSFRSQRLYSWCIHYLHPSEYT